MKTRKIIENKGVILFYILLIIISFLFSMRVEYLDSIEQSKNNNLIAETR